MKFAAYMDVSFIIFSHILWFYFVLLYMSFYVLYASVQLGKLCVLLCLCILIVVLYFLIFMLCILIVIFRYFYCFVCSVLCIVSLCCSVYCLCVNVYFTTATECQPNCS